MTPMTSGQQLDIFSRLEIVVSWKNKKLHIGIEYYYTLFELVSENKICLECCPTEEMLVAYVLRK